MRRVVAERGHEGDEEDHSPEEQEDGDPGKTAPPVEEDVFWGQSPSLHGINLYDLPHQRACRAAPEPFREQPLCQPHTGIRDDRTEREEKRPRFKRYGLHLQRGDPDPEVQDHGKGQDDTEEEGQHIRKWRAAGIMHTRILSPGDDEGFGCEQLQKMINNLNKYSHA